MSFFMGGSVCAPALTYFLEKGGLLLATTRIIPMHINKGKTLAQCLSDRLDYGENPEKTDAGKLITSYECDPQTADSEFLLSKKRYRTLTGRTQDNDVISSCC